MISILSWLEFHPKSRLWKFDKESWWGVGLPTPPGQFVRITNLKICALWVTSTLYFSFKRRTNSSARAKKMQTISESSLRLKGSSIKHQSLLPTFAEPRSWHPLTGTLNNTYCINLNIIHAFAGDGKNGRARRCLPKARTSRRRENLAPKSAGDGEESGSQMSAIFSLETSLSFPVA